MALPLMSAIILHMTVDAVLSDQREREREGEGEERKEERCKNQSLWRRLAMRGGEGA